jgi:hypothetical protein
MDGRFMAMCEHPFVKYGVYEHWVQQRRWEDTVSFGGSVTSFMEYMDANPLYVWNSCDPGGGDSPYYTKGVEGDVFEAVTNRRIQTRRTMLYRKLRLSKSICLIITAYGWLLTEVDVRREHGDEPSFRVESEDESDESDESDLMDDRLAPFDV